MRSREKERERAHSEYKSFSRAFGARRSIKSRNREIDRAHTKDFALRSTILSDSLTRSDEARRIEEMFTTVNPRTACAGICRSVKIASPLFSPFPQRRLILIRDLAFSFLDVNAIFLRADYANNFNADFFVNIS